jgi:enoyl-[acyl-carrier protein] reductase III
MREGSSIVAISSLGSQRVLANYVLVGTSKAAVESVVRYLAVELAPAIRVNAVSGGVVDTGALEHFPNKEEMLRSAERTPAGRLVEVDDIAGAVSFLCWAVGGLVRGLWLVVVGGFWLRGCWRGGCSSGGGSTRCSAVAGSSGRGCRRSSRRRSAT